MSVLPVSDERIESAVREALRKHAESAKNQALEREKRKQPPTTPTFRLENDHYFKLNQNTHLSHRTVLDLVAEALREELNLREGQTIPERVVAAIRGHFLRAQSMGLLLGGELGSYFYFGSTSGPATPFSFTDRGLKYYSSGLSLDAKGSLAVSLRALQARGHLAVTDEQVVVLDEAQLCWLMGCYRAAVILTGVASEASMSGLADDLLAAYGASLPTTAPGKNLKRELSISTRMAASFEVLRHLHSSLRGEANRIKAATGTYPAWSGSLQNPDSLHGMAEAIRQARNESAHDPLSTSAANDVTLLLSSMPTLLEKVAGIRDFLRAPPVPLPALP